MEKDLREIKFALAVNKIVDAYNIEFLEFIEVIGLNERLHEHLKAKNGDKNGKR